MSKEYFDPKTDKFPYTESTDSHYLVVKNDDGTVFDENYPYVDDSKSAKLKRALARLLLYTVVFPVARVRLGLKINGRENLKKHKEEIENGVISVSNHVQMWDYIMIMRAARPKKTNVIVWAPNIRGENGKMMRAVGGIPIPEGSMHATHAQIKAVGSLLDRGGWLHIYAEGSMWEYYAPVRPFKNGAAHFACKFNKPIVPLGFSYREPGWIRKNIFRQIAKFTLTVGEPIYPDQSLPRKERERDLTLRTHGAVCDLCGIDPKENIYPPVFDNSKRIDYYTDTYGVGYKGSH